MVRASLRTADLARAAQMSAQQVRNYEASGLLPPVERAPSGHRRYSGQHLAALETARLLVGGYGWDAARAILAAAHGGDLAGALALLDARHAALDRTRQQLAQTLAALGAIAGRAADEPSPRAAPGLRTGTGLRVAAAARLAGVRVSAVHFWEGLGLLQPAREPGSNYRLYDERQLRRLRVVALLRAGGYDFDAIRATLDELDAGEPARAVAAIERRRGELAAQSWRCLRAAAALYEYASDYLGGLAGA